MLRRLSAYPQSLTLLRAAALLVHAALTDIDASWATKWSALSCIPADAKMTQRTRHTTIKRI